MIGGVFCILGFLSGGGGEGMGGKAKRRFLLVLKFTDTCHHISSKL